LFLADKRYADTGDYPRRRQDVADANGSDELRKLARGMVSIDQADKAGLIKLAQSGIRVLDELKNLATASAAGTAAAPGPGARSSLAHRVSDKQLY
jgi:hypothetical protein